MLEFKSVQLSDKKEIDGYFKKANLGICEHCFTDVFIWQGHYKTMFTTDGDFLYIKSKTIDTNEDLFMFPVGLGDLNKAVEKVKEFAEKEQVELVFVSVTDELIEKLDQEMPDKFEFIEVRDSADYVYLSENGNN